MAATEQSHLRFPLVAAAPGRALHGKGCLEVTSAKDRAPVDPQFAGPIVNPCGARLPAGRVAVLAFPWRSP